MMAAAPFYHHVIVRPHDDGSYGVYPGCYADMMAKRGEGNARVIKVSIADSAGMTCADFLATLKNIIAESPINRNSPFTPGRMVGYLKGRSSEFQPPYIIQQTTMLRASYGTVGVLEGMLQL